MKEGSLALCQANYEEAKVNFPVEIQIPLLGHYYTVRSRRRSEDGMIYILLEEIRNNLFWNGRDWQEPAFRETDFLECIVDASEIFKLIA